jgi:hypothetical protein
MYLTARGPPWAPDRKLSVRSSGAPKSAAAAFSSWPAAGLVDDARKGVAGGAKLGHGWGLVTLGEL